VSSCLPLIFSRGINGCLMITTSDLPSSTPSISRLLSPKYIFIHFLNVRHSYGNISYSEVLPLLAPNFISGNIFFLRCQVPFQANSSLSQSNITPHHTVLSRVFHTQIYSKSVKVAPIQMFRILCGRIDRVTSNSKHVYVHLIQLS
jgi:hypothetical protein